MLQLEPLDDPIQPGLYVVEVCQYPKANADSRAYRLFEFDPVKKWTDPKYPRGYDPVIYAWYGPIEASKMEPIFDPEEMGYYAVHLQPWPRESPQYTELNFCVWRRGAWYDVYGWAKQYGNVLGWLGPFPLLPVEMPWLQQHEKELAEEIGL